MRRLFCAINVFRHKELDEIILFVEEIFRMAKVHWIASTNLHITLKFFGETPESLIQPICNALCDAAKEFPPFKLVFSGCGIFERKGVPQIIWLGFHPPDQVVALHHIVNHFLRSVGFEAENRVFVPHLTLGRIQGRLSEQIMESCASFTKLKMVTEVEVKSIHLMESLLKQEGAEYAMVREFFLGEGRRA